MVRSNVTTLKFPQRFAQIGRLMGAAIINKAGEEVPITEEMVLDACRALSNERWYPPKYSA